MDEGILDELGGVDDAEVADDTETEEGKLPGAVDDEEEGVEGEEL